MTPADAGRGWIIAGPTASGKSRLALALARQTGGVVINADSMQIYRGLEILTDQPGAADRAQAPHRLYGIFDASERGSAGRWRALALEALNEARAEGRPVIVTGGSGLYLKALVEGLAAIPPIPESLRRALRERLVAQGRAAFHAALAERDPEGAAALDPGDTQRLLRAAEVIEATGLPLSAWYNSGRQDAASLPLALRRVLVHPPREDLHRAILARLHRMLMQGAVEEAVALAERGLDPTLPAMKALGVAEFSALGRGNLSRDMALEQAAARSRRYAKRQGTWFRHQFITDLVIDEQFSERNQKKIITDILDCP